jgi:hypothetical protein
MDERLFNRIIQPTDANSNFSLILNRDLRPVYQYACESFSERFSSNLIISGIPYAVNTYRQFTAPVYAVQQHRKSTRRLSTRA